MAIVRGLMGELCGGVDGKFQMKDLEKIAPKQKGIVPQSVKEITQLLVDEGLVECEKIGTFVCYWAFPSQAMITRKKQLQELDEKISNLETKLKEAKADAEMIKKDKKETKEREKLKLQINDLQMKHDELMKKLEKLDEEGPEAIARLENKTAKARDDANCWTDNIFAAKKWCKKNFNIEEKVLNTQFEIPPELDYVE
uniref:Meiotic nuclear division protein 1 homolog n=1 Tax=Onchocerca volvulus TaxID=6282 RepID=A0A8R1TKP1_ONCVO